MNDNEIYVPSAVGEKSTSAKCAITTMEKLSSNVRDVASASTQVVSKWIPQMLPLPALVNFTTSLRISDVNR